MANSWYPKGLEGFALGEIDWDTAVIKVLAVRSGSFNVGHKFVSDLTGAGGVVAATSGALAGKVATDGILDANDLAPAFTAVAANATNHVLVVIQSSAVTGGADVAATAQRLILWLDTGTLLPFTTNGGDINITWDNAANKIAKL